MKLIDFKQGAATPIDVFNSKHTKSVNIADGHGETHVYCLYFNKDSIIDSHPTGYDQLFLVMSGSGWVTGGNNVRQNIHEGQGALFSKGELHSKGSDTGMTVMMIQVDTIQRESLVGGFT